MSIIIKPIVSEKVSALENKGTYGFVVQKLANKVEIKKAVEERYGVTVLSVNTLIKAGKRKRNRKTWQQDGRTATVKKAFITVKEGEFIDIYSNI